MAKRLWLTILLAVLIDGVGHIYLEFFKRGITILIIGIVSAMVASIFIPFPYNLTVIIGYWIWQIIDAYKHYKKLNPQQPQMAR